MRTLATLLFLFAPAALAQTWVPQASGTTADLAGVYFLDAATGFAVGDGGLLLSTTDGGQSWNAQTLAGGALDLEGIAFNPSHTVGLIATDDGPVLRTTNGGTTWTTIPTGAGDLRGVDWADEAVVWVAGREGSSAVSTDGGQTWISRPTGSAERTEDVAAVSAVEAWVANRSGELRRTTDGGQTWTALTSGTTEDLDDIQMLGGTGYVAAGDAVLKTVDGGQTWANVAAGEPEGEGLFFLDADTGWVVGDESGLIWFTADGGVTWTSRSAGVSGAFNRVHFPDSDHGWAVGDGGVIVAYVSGSTSAGAEAEAAAFELGAARPNPFAGRTELTLSLPTPQAVRVEVFDVLGRRIAALNDGPLAAGAHALVLDGAGLPGGLYVVRATGETFSTTRRALRLR